MLQSEMNILTGEVKLIDGEVLLANNNKTGISGKNMTSFQQTWNLSRPSMTTVTPLGVFMETFSSHLGNSSISRVGSHVNIGGLTACCINC
mgnify:FL=1